MTKQLKILHTVSNTQWGGQERRVFNECRWMADRGHEIIMVTPGGTPLFKKSKEESWKTYPVSFRGSGALKTYISLKRIFKETVPHILNTHGNMDAKLALTAARGMNIPCKILSRHVTPLVRNSWYNRLLYTRWSDLVFTTADCTTQQLVRDLGVVQDRAFTVSSGVIPPESMVSHQEAKQKIASAFNLGPDVEFIGYVGRLDDGKGISILIRAFNLIHGDFPGLHLVLVGEGGGKDAFKREILDLGLGNRVHMVGFQADPWPWYRGLGCKVLASIDNEGIAQSVLEAMFARCPVIGTNVGGLPDVIKNGVTGLLANPGSTEDLAEKIRDTLENKISTKQRINNAEEFVLTQHTIDAMGNKILSILNKAYGFK